MLKEYEIVCAWCKTLIKKIEAEGNDNELSNVSHGICEKCAEKLKREAKQVVHCH